VEALFYKKQTKIKQKDKNKNKNKKQTTTTKLVSRSLPLITQHNNHSQACVSHHNRLGCGIRDLF
jgi:hypothetical protein